MSKKDYIAIAKIFNESYYKEQSLIELAQALCPYFKRDNPLFNTQRFLDACFVSAIPHKHSTTVGKIRS